MSVSKEGRMADRKLPLGAVLLSTLFVGLSGLYRVTQSAFGWWPVGPPLTQVYVPYDPAIAKRVYHQQLEADELSG